MSVSVKRGRAAPAAVGARGVLRSRQPAVGKGFRRRGALGGTRAFSGVACPRCWRYNAACTVHTLQPHLAAAVEHVLLNVSTVLDLDPAAREFRVVYGAVATNDDAPPPKIYEWTNPRYDDSLVKGSVLQRRLGALATFLLEERVIPHPVDVSEATDVFLITEALEAWKRSQ